MRGDIRIRGVVVFTVVGLVLLGFLSGGSPGAPSPVSAQVDTEAVEIFRGQSGVFEVAVAVSPREPVVGGVHFSVEVLDVATMDTVTDARVLLVVHDEDDVPTIQTLVLNTPLDPDSYEGSLTFALPARWTLSVEVDSPNLGAVTFRVPLLVKAGTPLENPLGGFVLLGVIVAVVGCTAYLWHSARKAQRRRAAA